MLPKLEHTETVEAAEPLRAFIDAGDYAPGDRLPAERELISHLGLSRSALRKGLDALEREGKIWRHVGKGTFLSAPKVSAAFPRIDELSRQLGPVQMMRTRMLLEPAIAREAAVNATAEATEKLRTARDRALQAQSWDEYELHDDAFHECIADATGNVLLRSLFDHMNEVRRSVTWRQVIRKTDRPPPEHSSFAEHDAIFDAIDARDPVTAHDAMHAHLLSVRTRLFGDV